MSQYRTGTVNVTKDDSNVYGNGVDFVNNVNAGDWFIGPDLIKYEVTTVGQLGNDHFVRLSAPYGGSTIANASYVIQRDFLDGKPLMSKGDLETEVLFNQLVASTGSVEQIQAIADALSSQIVTGMSEAEFNSIAESNRRKFAGSGYVEFGKSWPSGQIQNGLWTLKESIVNTIAFGRDENDSTYEGDSLSFNPVSNIDGVIVDIRGTTRGDKKNYITLPPAPDGLDKKDGTGRFDNHAAAITAGGTSLNASIIDRSDLLGLEVWHEEIDTNGAVYPFGNVQYGATTHEGISLSNTVVAQGYSAFGEWDTETKGYGAAWNSLSDSARAIFIDDPKNNIYRSAKTGKLIQVRYRVRSIAGLGEEWENTDGQSDNNFIRQGTSLVLRVRGQTTDATDNSYEASSSNDRVGFAGGGAAYNLIDGDRGTFTPAKFSGGDPDPNGYYAHEGKCYFIPIALVSRRNQGAYHPVLNPNGSATWLKSGVIADAPWYNEAVVDIVSTAQCLTSGDFDDFGYYPASGAIADSGTVGRPDGKFYDAIYEGDVQDLRISARRKSKGDLLEEFKRKAISNEIRGSESESFWEVASVAEEVNVDSAATATFAYDSGTFSDDDIGSFVVVKNGDNTAYGYIRDTTTTSIFLSVTRELAYANTSTGVGFSRTQGATTTIYRVKETLKFKEMLQCDVIGDPANYYSGQDYTNTGASQVVTTQSGDVVFLQSGGAAGNIGHYYRSIGSYIDIDLNTQTYTNSTFWADLGTTYDGQDWTNDGTSQIVTVVIDEVVYNNGSSTNGIIGHYYRRIAGVGSVNLSTTDYASSTWVDLGRKYRGQQWTNDGIAQTVSLVIGDIIHLGAANNNGSGIVGNFYKFNDNGVAASYDINNLDYEANYFTDLGPDWNESRAAGSWLQDGIPGFPLLTHADSGESLIPDGTSKTQKMSRKVKETQLAIYSDDNGITWTVDTSSWTAGPEGSDNARTTSIPTGRMHLLFYTTDARFTEEANNSVVDMLGDVFASQSHQEQYGVAFVNSLIEKVPTSTNAGQRFGNAKMKDFAIGDDVLIDTYNLSHETLGYPNPNGSPAAKVLSYLSHENGRYYLQFLAKELIWDVNKDAVTDFTTANSSISATYTIGEYYWFTNKAPRKAYLCEISGTYTVDSLTEATNGEIVSNSGSLYFTPWDGTGWGDDNKFTVLDGTDAEEDLNGNNVIVTQQRVALPFLTGEDN
jgi:hypothetical protein